MPSQSTQTLLLSPAELNYLHTSLAQTPPLRPDGRTATQFRPLIAETALLPSTNGSARVCWSEGEECIVGIKCEVERTSPVHSNVDPGTSQLPGQASWVSLSIEIPGFRDDDALPVFLSSMLSEVLVQDGFLPSRLVINRLWHWRIWIDILLLSPPLSYPLPLLSLTTHLALLDTQLPRLVSADDEDPLFDDDWDAAVTLYSGIPLTGNTDSQISQQASRPPITLLVAVIDNKILFDPSKEELAVADAIVAVSLTTTMAADTHAKASKEGHSVERSYSLLGIRTIDPPARLTQHGIADEDNPAITINEASIKTGKSSSALNTSLGKGGGIWNPPVGGMSRSILGRITALCIAGGPGGAGVATEVFEGLEGFVVRK